MPRSKWMSVVSYLAVVLTMLFSLFSVASSQSQPGLNGLVLLDKHAACWYTSAFFNAQARAAVTYVNNGQTVSAAPNRVGAFAFPAGTAVPPVVTARCNTTGIDYTLKPGELGSGTVNIVLPNQRPWIRNLSATLNGQLVAGVPGGSTVSVSVEATDANGDALHYAWGANDGAVYGGDAPTAVWTLPTGRGVHAIYVLVTDGNGGFTEKRLLLSTDGGVQLAVGAYRQLIPLIIGLGTSSTPPPTPNPSDHTPANDQFLATWELDYRPNACAYYRDIGAVIGCDAGGTPTGYTREYATFDNWKESWGFGVSPTEVTAKYANLADLNLQRDMHMLTRGPDGNADVATYVCNYLNPDTDPGLSNVRLGNNLVACVAFEYRATPNYNGGARFTRFLTYGPAGDLQLSVNLDGRGEKYLPGSCTACHGGLSFGAYTAITATTSAKFIPFDLDNYHFANVSGFRLPDQEASLRRLNTIVMMDTDPYAPTRELIQGWYAKTGTFDGSFVPAAWQAQPDQALLYTAVVKPDCRMCHLSLNGLQFATPGEFAGWAAYMKAWVCGVPPADGSAWAMPNARQTFDRFWTSQGSTPAGVDAPKTLVDFMNSVNPSPITCALPSWMP